MIMGLENIKDMIGACLVNHTVRIVHVVIFDFGTTVMLHLQPNSVRIELHLEILSTKYEFHFAYKY